MRPTYLGATLAVVGLTLAAATACSSSPSSSSASHPTSTTATVGSDCSSVPKSGTGSLSGMPTKPVVTAASNNPQLTDITHAVDLADVQAKIDAAKPITVFAPNNDAFTSLEKELGSANVQKLESNTTNIRDVVEYHIVSGTVTPSDLASGKALTSWLGQPLHPSKVGSTYKINDADVVCGNLKTANATVYVINSVLEP